MSNISYEIMELINKFYYQKKTMMLLKGEVYVVYHQVML